MKAAGAFMGALFIWQTVARYSVSIFLNAFTNNTIIEIKAVLQLKVAKKQDEVGGVLGREIYANWYVSVSGNWKHRGQ